MLDLRKLNFEYFLYLIAVFLGVILRFYNLGAAPLSDSEAGWALQALAIANPSTAGNVTMGQQPAYILFTGVLFALFGASNFLARFWPALTGCLLILLPIAFRWRIGRVAALVLAFGLAIDPGLVTVSRQAGSPMMALSFTLWAIVFAISNLPTLAGVSAGLALLSGTGIYTAAVSFALAWALYKILSIPNRKQEPQTFNFDEKQEEPSLPDSQPFQLSKFHTRRFVLSAAITLLLAGTLFFRYPQGLSAWMEALSTYLAGWITPSGIPASRLLAALLFYEPLPLIFAAITIVRILMVNVLDDQRPSRFLIFLALWVVSALLFVLAYPSRQVADLIWVIVPLWALASIELAKAVSFKRVHPLSLAQACLIFLLAGLIWITLGSTLLAVGSDTSWLGLRLIIVLGIVAMGVLTTILVAWGWSWEVSRTGLTWGLIAILFVYSTSLLWGATQLRPNLPQELWSTPPATGQAKLLMRTIDDLSNWNEGFAGEIDILSMVDLPSLRWALRNYHQTRFLADLPPNEQPAIIIGKVSNDNPTLNTAYRGQDFVWGISPGWQGALPEQVLRWFALREATLQNELLILWARSDLFQGEISNPPKQLNEQIK